jgi:hypothetical protein
VLHLEWIEERENAKRECKKREKAKRKGEKKKRQERECVTLLDKCRATRDISLGCGCEERERKRAKRERLGEKCCVCHGMMVGFFCCFCWCCFMVLSLCEAGRAPTLSFASSVCSPAG